MKVLAVVAHPDDEVLGLGGTLRKHVLAGNSVHVLFTFEGVSARGNPDDCWDSALATREQAAKKAADLLGYHIVEFGKAPNLRSEILGRLDFTKYLLSHLTQIQPEIVYTHSPLDVNLDHRFVSESVTTACRPVGNLAVRTIRHFETPSATEWAIPMSKQIFNPDTFINIEDCLDDKIKALRCYDSELRNSPHPRSIEYIKALAVIRGGQVGLRYAEAFHQVRHLEL